MLLAERPGRVVTKDEPFAGVWPNTAVGDAALVTCIQEIRKALRDDARRPRYIETQGAGRERVKRCLDEALEIAGKRHAGLLERRAATALAEL